MNQNLSFLISCVNLEKFTCPLDRADISVQKRLIEKWMWVHVFVCVQVGTVEVRRHRGTTTHAMGDRHLREAKPQT